MFKQSCLSQPLWVAAASPAMASLMKNFWAWLVMARASLQRYLCLSMGRCRLQAQHASHPSREVSAGSGASPAARLTQVMHGHAPSLFGCITLSARGDFGGM